MKKSKKQKKASTRTIRKAAKQLEAYYTVGIRLLIRDMHRVWTYRVRRSAKLQLGTEVVVDTPLGPRIGYVVRIDKTPTDRDIGVTYKFVERATRLL